MGDTRRSQFGKMFTELLARHRAKTSEQSSKPSGKSVKETIAFLDMRKTDLDGKNGRSEGSSWEIIPLSLGEDLTLNFGESPKDASVCSLFSILEDNVPDRYFLSVTACKGILRRSEERGKPLDPLLKQALLNTIVFMQSKITPKTSECPSAQITSSKPSQDAWAQGGNVPLILVPCYGQTSYDEYQPSEQSTTLKASGGNYGGGTETLVLEAVNVDIGICNGGAGKSAGSVAFSTNVSPTLKAASSGLQSPVACIPYTLKIRGGCEGGVREL